MREGLSKRRLHTCPLDVFQENPQSGHSGARRDCGRHQDGIAHSMEQLFIRWHNRGERAAQVHLPLLDKIIGTEPHPAAHSDWLIRTMRPVRVFHNA